MSGAFPATVVVTGGAGFIGSALVRRLIREKVRVINVDKLTYAGNLDSLSSVESSSNYHFEQADILDHLAIEKILAKYSPGAIFHLAAESHVDRSIDSAEDFIQTNIVGTYRLLESTLRYWQSLAKEAKEGFRFLHVSTDEVFGSLGPKGFFTETTPYQPHSPYSASKAASDHLVRAWSDTFKLPVLITNCSNNFGPYQFPEKLIPVVILNAIHEKPIPVYGRGENVRDWLYVDDHVSALLQVLSSGRLGETYLISGRSEKNNVSMVNLICEILDEIKPRAKQKKYSELIQFVSDRPAHDWRYAIDPSKMEKELGWKPAENFEKSLRKTVSWYLENLNWCERVASGMYRKRQGLARFVS